MKVYLVGVYDADGSNVAYVCSTNEKAVEKFNELRNGLIKNYKDMIEFNCDNLKGVDLTKDKESYEKVIGRLQEEDPSVIDNWPHETPYILEKEVI